MAKTRPVASMTGFARQEGGDGTIAWTWEIKSVNGKSLDLRCRLPAGYEELDALVRAAAVRAHSASVAAAFECRACPMAPIQAECLEGVRED